MAIRFPRPRKEPSQDRAQATVDAILEAAALILERETPEANPRIRSVSTTTIAERAGVSVGSLYQYFPNLDALVSSLLRRFVRTRWKEIEAAIGDIEHLPLEEATARLAAKLIELELRHRSMIRVLMGWFTRVGNLDLIAEADHDAEAALATILSRLAAKTRPLDPNLAAFFLLHALRNLLGTACYRRPEMLVSAEAHEELRRLIYGYLRPDVSTAGGAQLTGANWRA